MTLTELKKSIHEKIDNSNDVELLEKVNALVSPKEEVFQIPEVHLKGIEEGIEDGRNGHFLTKEEFKTRYEKWLKD